MLVGHVRLAGGHGRPPEEIRQATITENTKIYNFVTCRLTSYIRDVLDIFHGFKVHNFEAIYRTCVTV